MWTADVMLDIDRRSGRVSDPCLPRSVWIGDRQGRNLATGDWILGQGRADMGTVLVATRETFAAFKTRHVMMLRDPVVV